MEGGGTERGGGEGGHSFQGTPRLGAEGGAKLIEPIVFILEKILEPQLGIPRAARGRGRG